MLALSLGFAAIANAWTPDGCKPFKEIYTDGEDLINRMWGNSFKYEADESKAEVGAFARQCAAPERHEPFGQEEEGREAKACEVGAELRAHTQLGGANGANAHATDR